MPPMKLASITIVLCLGLGLIPSVAADARPMDRVAELPALQWFDMPALDRTKIVAEIADAADANFLDVFACITLFAKDKEHRSAPLGNVLWLCSPMAN